MEEGLTVTDTRRALFVEPLEDKTSSYEPLFFLIAIILLLTSLFLLPVKMLLSCLNQKPDMDDI